jgi:hypothetical protein
MAAAAALALAAAAVPMAGASASTASSGYTVQQVNPTTWTNTLAKKVPAIPLVQGNYIIKTRSGSAVRELTSQGDGLDMVLKQTGFSTFNKSSPAGATGDIYTTPGGYCAHGTTNNLVISSTSCGGNNTSSQWFGDGNGRLECVCNGNYMGANANAENEVVRLEPSSGAYYLTPFNIG